MKNKIFFSCAMMIFVLLSYSPLYSGGIPQDKKIDPATTQSLKQLMGKFGTLMAGIEILRVKEKHPDWETIDLTLTEMTQTLNAMQTIDTTHAYKPYTDLLAAGLSDLKKKSAKKDKNIYDGFGKLSNTCFSCHAAHRPADFLTPKGKRTARTP